MLLRFSALTSEERQAQGNEKSPQNTKNLVEIIKASSI